MKIIFLNVWKHDIRDELADFIKEHVPTTDVFCFQEAHEIDRVAGGELADFQKFDAEKYISENIEYVQATYVRSKASIKDEEVIFPEDSAIGLALALNINGQIVCNAHGISRPNEKVDSPGRLLQTKGLIEFFKSSKQPVIIGGDFNLFPDTESVVMFERAGYRNLIKEYGITTTRNRLAWEKYPDNPHYFADYVFVSPEVEVVGFEVIDNEVSDHLPMVLTVR